MAISEIFTNKNGRLSSMRTVFVIWSIGLLLAWGYISFDKKELQKIDNSIIMLIGILTTGKVSQTYAEKPEKENNSK